MTSQPLRDSAHDFGASAATQHGDREGLIHSGTHVNTERQP